VCQPLVSTYKLIVRQCRTNIETAFLAAAEAAAEAAAAAAEAAESAVAAEAAAVVRWMSAAVPPERPFQCLLG